MKKQVLLGITFMLLSTGVWSQKTNYSPSPDNAKIIVAFDAKFPEATKVGWNRDLDEIWHAYFQWDKKDYEVTYNEKGQWLVSEYKVKKGDVPEEILATVLKDFEGYKIDDIEITESPGGKLFGFALVKGKEQVGIFINPTGEIVSR